MSKVTVILEFSGRSDRIRTCDLCNPIATRYQAAPRSDLAYGLCDRLACPPKTRRILARSFQNEKPLLRFYFNWLEIDQPRASALPTLSVL